MSYRQIQKWIGWVNWEKFTLAKTPWIPVSQVSYGIQ